MNAGLAPPKEAFLPECKFYYFIAADLRASQVLVLIHFGTHRALYLRSLPVTLPIYLSSTT